MGHDRRFLPEDTVASGVITMPVGVHEELQLGVADLCRCSANLGGQRRELIVDHQDAVVADQQADVSSDAAVEHVDIAGYVDGLELHAGKVALGDGVTNEQEQGGRGQENGTCHGNSLALGCLI